MAMRTEESEPSGDGMSRKEGCVDCLDGLLTTKYIMKTSHPLLLFLLVCRTCAATAFLPPIPLPRSSSCSWSLAAHPIDRCPYKPSKIAGEHYDTVVIGSGIGGLSTASLLAQQGQKVLVLDQHYVAGGACHTFTSKEGYRFGTGIHYVGDMEYRDDDDSSGLTLKWLMDSLTLPNDPVQWDKMEDPMETIVLGDGTTAVRYDVLTGEEEQKKKLLERFPSEEKAINTFFILVHKARKSYHRALLLKSLPLKLAKLLTKTGLHRLIDGGFHKWSSITVQEGLDKLTDNKDLQAVLSYNWGDYGVEPARAPFVMQLLCASTFLNGGFYPHGGPQQIPCKVIQQINDCGGNVLVSAPVKRIVVDEDNKNHVTGVEMEDGTMIPAKTVVSSAGLINTVTKLLPPHLVNIDFARDDSSSSDKLHPGTSAINLFVGLKGNYKSLNLPQSQFWLYPSNNYSKSIQNLKSMSLQEALKMDPADLTPVFVGNGSAKDHAWSHPDKTALEIITMGTQWHWFSEFANMDKRTRSKNNEYEAVKLRFANMMWKRVVEVFDSIGAKLPKSLEQADYFSVGTPITFTHYYKSTRGAFYGLDHDLTRFKPENFYVRLRPEVPEVPGLYLTGQDVVADSLVGAMCGGLLCAQKVLGMLNPLQLLRKDDHQVKEMPSEEAQVDAVYI